MSLIELKYPAIRESFDLGVFDEGIKGQTLTLLMNPSARFKREFTRARGDEFIEYIAFICGWSADEAKINIEDMQPDVLQWLFVGAWDAGDTDIVMPHVIALWDAYATRRVKDWGRPSAKPSAMMVNLPEAEEKADDQAAPHSPSLQISSNGFSDESASLSATESTPTLELV